MTRLSRSTFSLGSIIRNLGGHEYGVRSVAFSPDGESLASGSFDRTIRLWDAHDPFPSPSTNHHPFQGHTAAITSISYSHSGSVLASGSVDCTIRLWEPSNGRMVGRPLEGHTGFVNSVAFSPGANLIASGSADKTVRLWDIRHRGYESVVLKGHSNWVHSVAFSHYGGRVVSGSHDKTIRIWDVETRSAVNKPLEGHTRAICSVAFSSNGNQIVSGSEDSTIQLWDVRTGKLAGRPYTGHTQGVYSIATSPNGLYIASGSWDKTVRVWDVRNGRLVAEPFRRHTQRVNSVGFAPCSTRIVSGSEDHNIMIWRFLEEDHEDDAESPSSEIVDCDMTTLHSFHFEPALNYSLTFENTQPPQILRTLRPLDGAPRTQAQYRTEVTARPTPSEEIFRQMVAHGCVDLTSEVDPSAYSPIAINGGAMGNIYKGRLRDNTGIAVKVWRASSMPEDGSKHMKRAMREVYYWSKMRHENIQELLGVVLLHNQLGMVSLWMENGNLKDYIRINPASDRYSLCNQVAAGVSHLHTNGMVHGDLKAVNILVSTAGIAKISDFGHSILSDCSLAFSDTTNRGGGTLRWMAPELLEDNALAERSRECDVYALGMTILEIFTGRVPYAEYQTENRVLGALCQKKPPKQPEELHGPSAFRLAIWRMLLECWDYDPAARPSAYQISQFFEDLVKGE